MKVDVEIHDNDQRTTDLANKISDAVHKAKRKGLETDFICSILIAAKAPKQGDLDG